MDLRRTELWRKSPIWERKIVSTDLCVYLIFISLIADEPQRCHPACGSEGYSHPSPVHTLRIFIAIQVHSALTTRQGMVEFYFLTLSRFLLRTPEQKPCFEENRTHDFRTSRCAGYILDHSGNEGYERDEPRETSV